MGRDNAASEVAFIRSLRSRRLKATPQRVVVYRILQERDGHMTADEVMAAAARDLPNVSLPTIYAALQVLEELGLVRRVASLGGTALYDSRAAAHHHALCRVCGKVWDLDVAVDDGPARLAATAAGLQPEQAQVTVQGICAECAERRPARLTRPSAEEA
ncbi:MAG TPA: Fur family transcriptional regulator [Candidatus Dormibacteraeota bacterium]|jgi:Fe2+ or Zn2+ uptake regulation protein|nr:Fur family transcriptional regulator [Candidatus Dormibacteraeota bacterium]